MNAEEREQLEKDICEKFYLHPDDLGDVYILLKKYFEDEEGE